MFTLYAVRDREDVKVLVCRSWDEDDRIRDNENIIACAAFCYQPKDEQEAITKFKQLHMIEP